MSASTRFWKQLPVASIGFWEKVTELGVAAASGVVFSACLVQVSDRSSRKQFERTMVAKMESIELMMAGIAAATAEKEAAVRKQG